MDNRKHIGKMVIGMLLLLGMCGIGKAQQCTATIAASGHSESDVFTGTSVAQGSYSLAGIGIEEAQGFNVGTHNSASVTIPTGDFTWQGEVNTLSGGTAPRADFELLSPMAKWTDHFDLYVINNSGTLTVYFDYGQRHLGSIGDYRWIHIGSQSVSGLNLSLKLVRSGNNLTASVATDNVNYLTVGTFAGTAAPTGTVSLITDSGDYTTVATATYSSVLLNGATPSLTPSTPFGGGFISGVVTQTGTFNTATSVSGSITLSNCPAGSTASAVNNTRLGVANGFTVTGPTNSCTSICSFSAVNPVTGTDAQGTVAPPPNNGNNFISNTTVTVYGPNGVALTSVVLPTITVVI